MIDQVQGLLGVGQLTGVAQLTGGYYHMCARLSGGTVRCWGDDHSGQLGNGYGPSSPTPRTVPGVADVVTFGGFERNYQICVDPIRLTAAGISVDDVHAAIARANENAGGGYSGIGSQEFVVRGMGVIRDPRELGDIVIDTRGAVALDDDFADELAALADEVDPTEVLIAVDSMTGQEAVNVAKASTPFRRAIRATSTDPMP